MSEFRDTDLGQNPYRSPSECGDAGQAGPVVTHTVLTLLAQTQPWVRFLSVLGFILAGLMVLVGLIAGVVMMGRGPGSVIFFIYVPMSLLYFIPSLFLFRYASRIAELRRTGSVAHLEEALAAQKSFWKFVGIAMLVVIALYLLALAAAFVLPLLMHTMR